LSARLHFADELCGNAFPFYVMPGLVPGIHARTSSLRVDARVKHGHDVEEVERRRIPIGVAAANLLPDSRGTSPAMT